MGLVKSVSNLATPPTNLYWLMSFHETWPHTATYSRQPGCQVILRSVMETESVFEMLVVLNNLTHLSGQEDFTASRDIVTLLSHSLKGTPKQHPPPP